MLRNQVGASALEELFTPGDDSTFDVKAVGGEYGRPAFAQLDDGTDDILVPINDTGEVIAFVDLPKAPVVRTESEEAA